MIQLLVDTSYLHFFFHSSSLPPPPPLPPRGRIVSMYINLDLLKSSNTTFDQLICVLISYTVTPFAYLIGLRVFSVQSASDIKGFIKLNKDQILSRQGMLNVCPNQCLLI